MRKILFRGKRLDNGEWLYGDLRQAPYFDGDTATYIMAPIPGSISSYINYPVDPSTVGQYTGLCDNKNGKKIFEGDIVKFTRINALGYTTRRTGDVRYYDKLPVFYIKATTGDAWDWCVCEDIEVIGNIHDNPELLEGE